MTPAPGTLTRRLLRHYDASSEENRALGRAWYDDARAFCTYLGAEYDYPVETVAAVVAVLSPRTHWADNLTRCARAMVAASRESESLDWPTVTALGANVAKAINILNGANPADVVRGPKVTAFWRNLCGDPTAVTVDVWALRAAGMSDQPGARTLAAVYAAYERAAARRDETPSSMQAIVWIAARGSAT